MVSDLGWDVNDFVMFLKRVLWSLILDWVMVCYRLYQYFRVVWVNVDMVVVVLGDAWWWLVMMLDIYWVIDVVVFGDVLDDVVIILEGVAAWLVVRLLS